MKSKAPEKLNIKKHYYELRVQPKLKLIQNWCKDGELEATICKRLGVGISTFARYKNKYEELREALKNGKMEIDYMVENSLLKKALGYKIKEVQKITDPDGGLTIKETLKEIPPDTTAQIFWLKNRVKDKWRDVNKVKLQGNIEVNSLQKLSDADLEKLAIKYSIKV